MNNSIVVTWYELSRQNILKYGYFIFKDITNSFLWLPKIQIPLNNVTGFPWLPNKKRRPPSAWVNLFRLDWKDKYSISICVNQQLCSCTKPQDTPLVNQHNMQGDKGVFFYHKLRLGTLNDDHNLSVLKKTR